LPSFFVLLGAAFIASTGLLIYEFQRMEWFAVLAVHSYLFFFFPVLGILALVAFYLPAVIFTHLYWHHLRFGKLRYALGVVVVAAAAFGFAKYLDKPPALDLGRRRPPLCRADRGDQASRRGVDPRCDGRRARQVGRGRIGCRGFARPCSPDPRLEMPDEMIKERYCFPAKDASQRHGVLCRAGEVHGGGRTSAGQSRDTLGCRRRSMAGCFCR
jgi:hypothetical protein